ncbi:peptidase C65 Otubain-domain-containing protein [Mrakia frigida]|uniref:OTU family ubiquitin thioesterase n=1 Tax=Mrakia frigida TaxID=29902 RepID=UPI003FCBF1A5
MQPSAPPATSSDASANANEPPRVVNEETNLSDLTDQEIIALSQRMNEDSEADKRPLLSPPAPLSVLREEYERGSAIFVKKIDALIKDGWKTVWRAKGDGDCFYRAFALAFSLRIISSLDPALEAQLAASKIQECVPRFLEAGFMEMVFEDFLETFSTFLQSLGTTPPPSAAQVLSQLQDPETSNSIVVLLRLVTSSWIRSKPEEFEFFLMGPDGEMLSVLNFCQNEVEACGKEADNVQIMALSACLDVPIKIAYLDASGDGSHVDMHSFGPEGASEVPLNLLYRPGHYDFLQ